MPLHLPYSVFFFFSFLPLTPNISITLASYLPLFLDDTEQQEFFLGLRFSFLSQNMSVLRCYSRKHFLVFCVFPWAISRSRGKKCRPLWPSATWSSSSILWHGLKTFQKIQTERTFFTLPHLTYLGRWLSTRFLHLQSLFQNLVVSGIFVVKIQRKNMKYICEIYIWYIFEIHIYLNLVIYFHIHRTYIHLDLMTLLLKP